MLSREELEHEALLDKHYARCLVDPPYFYRQELHVRTEQRTVARFGRLFPTQQILQDQVDRDRTSRRPTRMLVLKARRHRVTHWAQAYNYWNTWANENTNALTIAHDDATTQEISNIVRVFWENQPEDGRPMRSRDNKRGLVFANPEEDQGARLSNPGLRSSFAVANAAGAGRKTSADAQLAAGLARGQMLHVVHGSEVAFWPNGAELAQALFQTLPMEPGVVLIYETTAAGMAGWFYEQWTDNPAWTKLFLPWFAHPLYRIEHVARVYKELTPKADETKRFDEFAAALRGGLMAQAERLAARLRLDAEERALAAAHHEITWSHILWRRWKIAQDCGNDVEVFHTEYPSTATEAFASTGRPRFAQDKVFVYLHTAREQPAEYGLLVPSVEGHDPLDDARIDPQVKWQPVDPREVEPHVPVWRKYGEPDPGRAYLIGADSATGRGGQRTADGRDRDESRAGDDSVALVLERETNTHIATLQNNAMELDVFAAQLVLASWYFRGGVPKGALVVPEVDGPGNTTVTLLRRAKLPRLWWRKEQRTAGEQWVQEYGWSTANRANRDALIDRFALAIKNGQFRSRDEWLWRQCTTFVIHPPKSQFGLHRVDHARGYHDDVLFAAMIAFFVNEIEAADEIANAAAQEEPLVDLWSFWGEWPKAPHGGENVDMQDDVAVALRRAMVR